MQLWPYLSSLNGDGNGIIYLTIFLKMYIIDSNYFSWNLLILLWNRFCCGFDSFLPFCSSSCVESSLISSPWSSVCPRAEVIMLLASRTSRLYARKGGAGICGRLLSQSNKPVTKNSPSRAKDIIISGLSITVVLGALYLFETKKKEAAKVKSMSKSVGKVFQIQSLESLLLMSMLCYLSL